MPAIANNMVTLLDAKRHSPSTFNLRMLVWLPIFLLTLVSARAHSNAPTDSLGGTLRFVENKGQWNAAVRFKMQTKNHTLFLENGGFTVVVQHADNDIFKHPRPTPTNSRYRQHAYKVTFREAAPVAPTGEKMNSDYENFFIGNDESRWATGVRNFQSVIYKQLYKGVDIRFYSSDEALKYDIIVQPHANVDHIALVYEGTDGLLLKGENLIVQTSSGDVIELKPYAYQIIDGRKRQVKAKYKVAGNVVSFEVGAYDRNHEFIIDPYLHFSTLTGSTSDNWGTTSAYDSYKNTYTAGIVFATGYPTSLGAYDGTYNGNADIGIFKLDTNGHQRLYATYIGGALADMPHSMFVNAFDELVVFGTTGSADFPTTLGAYDRSFNGGPAIYYESNIINFPNGSDIFVSRFSSDGTQLQASTFVGGTDNDGLNYRQRYNSSNDIVMLGNDSLYYNYGDGARGEIITDDLNNIYVGSTTLSNDFPITPGCVQPTKQAKQDGVVFKLDYNLSHLMWSTYLGGNGDDAVYSIDTDHDYNLVVCGGTNSNNFPTTARAYRSTYAGGSADAFVSKISYIGDSLMSSTYYGSDAYDQSYFVRTGKGDDVFIFGQTCASGSTLIHNASYSTPNSGQFIARFSPELDSLVWSTVFGTGSGEPNISPTAFAADICNRVYVAGWGRKFGGYYLRGQNIQWNTHGTWGMTVTPGAYQSTTDGQDFYVMSLDASASRLEYATFFGGLHTTNNSGGGDHVDGGTSRFDRLATLYQSVCAACGATNNFPTTAGSWSTTNNSNNCNNGIFRMNITNDFPVAEFTQVPVGCSPYLVRFHNTGRGTSFSWTFGDGTTSSQTNPTHMYASPGRYTVRLIATMPEGCRTADTMEQTITVLGGSTLQLDTLSTCTGLRMQIGVRPQIGCTYRWLGAGVSDSTIANPYVSQSGNYTLIISTEGCADTLRQVVILGEARYNMEIDSTACTSPHLLAVNALPGAQFVWSSDRLHSDTLNDNTYDSRFRYNINSSQWLYLRVTDRYGCVSDDSTYIRFYSVIDSLRVWDATCSDRCDGGAEFFPSAEAASPTYFRWGNSMWTDRSIDTTLCVGTYIFSLRDANGCQVDTNITISSPTLPTVSQVVGDVYCRDSCNGSVALSISGSSTYSLSWDDNGDTALVRNNLCPGTYGITITDLEGCTHSENIIINNRADFSLSPTILHHSCLSSCEGKAEATLRGGQPPYTYRWSNGEGTAVAERLCPGQTTIAVSDANGCVETDTVTIIAVNSFANMDVWADDSIIFAGESTWLHATEIPQALYSWTPRPPLSTPQQPNTRATLTDSTTFTVVVTDSAGCTFADSVRVLCVTVDCGRTNIFIPNIFTPNGDGVNDRLCLRGEWIVDFHIAIFSRWGEKVFESDDVNECWDGTFRGQPCQQGVYTYTCRVKCEAGQTGDFKGDVTLIR